MIIDFDTYYSIRVESMDNISSSLGDFTVMLVNEHSSLLDLLKLDLNTVDIY